MQKCIPKMKYLATRCFKKHKRDSYKDKEVDIKVYRIQLLNLVFKHGLSMTKHVMVYFMSKV